MRLRGRIMNRFDEPDIPMQELLVHERKGIELYQRLLKLSEDRRFRSKSLRVRRFVTRKCTWRKLKRCSPARRCVGGSATRSGGPASSLGILTSRQGKWLPRSCARYRAPAGSEANELIFDRAKAAAPFIGVRRMSLLDDSNGRTAARSRLWSAISREDIQVFAPIWLHLDVSGF